MAGGGSSEVRELEARVAFLELQVADLQGIVHGRDVPCSPPSGGVGAATSPSARGGVRKPPSAGRITMKRVK
jgi:hypothetical protein